MTATFPATSALSHGRRVEMWGLRQPIRDGTQWSTRPPVAPGVAHGWRRLYRDPRTRVRLSCGVGLVVGVTARLLFYLIRAEWFLTW